MATETAKELEAFHQFIGDRLLQRGSSMTPEQALDTFRTYLRDRDRFQAETQQALEESARGASQPLDVEALKQRVRARLAADGIKD